MLMLTEFSNFDTFLLGRTLQIDSKTFVDDDPIWAITWNKDEEDLKLGVTILDGITGAIIKEYEEDYPEEE